MKKPLLSIPIFFATIAVAEPTLEEALDFTGDELAFSTETFLTTTETTADGVDALYVLSVTTDLSAYLYLTPNVSGYLTVKLFTTNDYLDFDLQRRVNNSWQDLGELNGSASWAENRFFVKAATSYRISAYSYRNYDGSTSDAGIDSISFAPIEVGDLGQALDSTLVFTNTGEHGLWAAQSEETADGVDALAATAAGAQLDLQVTGPGLIRFTGRRQLGEFQVQLDGEQVHYLNDNWSVRDFLVPEGSHTVSWVVPSNYYYNSSLNEPYAYLDQVTFEPTIGGEFASAVDTDRIQLDRKSVV